MLLKLLILACVLPVILADICPLQNHTVCNNDEDNDYEFTKAHKCVCAMGASEKPPPEKSCNFLVNVIDKDHFPAISMTLKLDSAVDTYTEFPEKKFKEEIASVLRKDEKDILILRLGCLNNENEKGKDAQIVVQFVVKNNEARDEKPPKSKAPAGKNDNNDDAEDEDESEEDDEKAHLNKYERQMPYEADDFVDPEEVLKKMIVETHLTQIADMDVDEVNDVTELIDIEGQISNQLLIIQTVVVCVVIVLTCLLGCFFAARKNNEPEYSDNLQKV